MTIKEMILGSLNSSPDTAAIEYRDGEELISVSRRELHSRMNALGTYLLHKQGAGYIYILGENSANWITVYFTAICGAGIAAGLEKDLPADELIDWGKRIGPGVIFYSGAYESTVSGVMKSLPEHSFINMDSDDFSNALAEGERLLDAGSRLHIDSHTGSDDLAEILCTSGTSAARKGVMISQKNVATITIHYRKTGMKPNQRYSILLPLHHCYGLGVLTWAIASGGTACILPGFKRIFENIKFFKPDFLSFVPALAAGLLSALDAYDLKGPDAVERFLGYKPFIVICGGAPIPLPVMEELIARGLPLCDSFGMTETAGIISTNPLEDIRPGTVGCPIDGCQVKIAPDGEILLRGDNLMLGYLGSDGKPEFPNIDGWFATGDIGTFEDGYISIKGRKKNIIMLSNGKNVYPEELENKLMEPASVSEVCIYQEGEEIVAEVYSADSRETVLGDILEITRTWLSYQRPHRVELREKPFERSATNKIKRRNDH